MSSQNQDSESQNRDIAIELGRQTSQDNIERDSIPRKRKSWLAPTLFFVNTILIIVYGYFENTEVLVNIGLSLLGVLLAPIFRCLCIFVEELFQFRSRYKRNIRNLFKQCFSGISWKPVIAFALIDVILCLVAKFAKESSFVVEDAISISSGISVGPLVAYLLQLNAQSDVDLSRLLEGKGLHPAYILVLNYYINYLEKALLVFNRHFFSRSSPMQAQASNEYSDRDTESKTELSSKRLILLFSDNYKKEVDLVDLDRHISKTTDKCVAGYNFPVYGLKYNTNEYKFVILFAVEPLEFIQRFPDYKKSNFVHSELFYRTLVFEILSNDHFCRDKCIPILITETQSLDNGGLVKLIMKHVKTEECVPVSNATYHAESRDPLVSTERPQNTDDTLVPSPGEGTSSSEHVMGIKHAESFLGHQSSEKAIAPQPQLRKRKEIGTGSDSAMISVHNLETSCSILKGEIALMKQLQQWLGEKCKWNLCYRASRDGWKAKDFHKHCDNKGPTVVLVKANDCIFGGYTDQHWDSSGYGASKRSNSSFLFSLRNNDKLVPFIANIKQNQEQNATFCYSGCGPSFGAAIGRSFDLYICDNPLVYNDSFSNFGNTYQLPQGYVYGSEQAKNLLAGQTFFRTTEIEVFN